MNDNICFYLTLHVSNVIQLNYSCHGNKEEASVGEEI